MWRERRLNRRLLTDMTSERQAEGAKGSGVGDRGEEGATGLDSARKAQRAGKLSFHTRSSKWSRTIEKHRVGGGMQVNYQVL